MKAMPYNPNGTRERRRVAPPRYKPIINERSQSPRPRVASTVNPVRDES